MSKESVYDDEISPLMAQIITICKREHIPIHASFALDGDLLCTTHVHPENVRHEDRPGERAWKEKYMPLIRQLHPTGVLAIATSQDGKIVAHTVIL